MKKKISHLVVDSGAFIRNAPINEYSENVYTVKSAVKEIKDKATLQRLQVLPYDLKMREPLPENYKYVMEFSKKTGDYASLSATDLQIIALTYELEKFHVGTEHLKSEPSCQVTSKPPVDLNKPMEGFYCPQDEEDNEDEDSLEKSEDSSRPAENLILNKISEGDTNYEEANNDDHEENGSEELVESADDEIIKDDDEESWITPQNLTEVQRKMGDIALDSDSDIVVACVTTDFAMQNVLLQMGLHVVSVDGYLIRHMKVFILRCFACFKTTTDVTKIFCPNCGNKTLKKVSVTVGDDGSKNIHINFKRPINIRGMKYSLPMPKGGKHAVNPHICEDQPFPQNRPSKAYMKKVDVFSPDYVASVSPFAVRDIYSRAANIGVYGLKKNQQQRRNMNEWSKRTGNRKHKK